MSERGFISKQGNAIRLYMDKKSTEKGEINDNNRKVKGRKIGK